MSLDSAQPRVVAADGEVWLEGDEARVRLRSDPLNPDWWHVDSPQSEQGIHTDDPDMVALFWFCCEVSQPPWIACEMISELSIRVTAGDEAHVVEGETLPHLRRGVLRFLGGIADALGGDTQVQ